MLPVLLSAVIISFSGVMMPGPMFAIALTKSFKSPLAGTWMSLGHAVVEIPIILLIYLGFSQFFRSVPVQFVLSVLGGGMILWLGISMLRTRTDMVRSGKDVPYNAFAAGILTTGLNPFFLLWWATIGSMLIMRIMDFGGTGLALLVLVHWSCDLIWLSFVSVTVYKTHSIWKPRFQEWLFAGCSLLLAGFGIWFVVSGVQLLF